MHSEVRCTAVPMARAKKTLALMFAFASLASASAQAQVSALGRLEPLHGTLKITAPITPESTGTGNVLAKLFVDRGDNVKAGQLLAVTEAAELMQAQVQLAKVEREYQRRLANAATSSATSACVQSTVAVQVSARRQDLLARKLSSSEDAERAQGDADAGKAACAAARANAGAATSAVAVADAALKRAQAVMQRAYIRAPVAGRILDVHARPGEQIGPQASSSSAGSTACTRSPKCMRPTSAG